MKIIKLFFMGLIAALTTGCENKEEVSRVDFEIQKSSRPAWYDENPEIVEPSFSAKTEPVRLHFYGWGLDEDTVVRVTFPNNTDKYRRAILTYRMGGWNEGPAEWDMTTMIMLKNKKDGKFYELARAFTPYGSRFSPTWEKNYYMDITEYLPMLTGETEFHIYYGGWDATDKRAHTVTLTFNFYEGEKEKNTIYYTNVYDSRSSSNIGYRSWAYGVSGHDIEAPERLGEREITLPEEVKSLLMKVSISGHGADYGFFPDRGSDGMPANNAAEFDRNTYRMRINGQFRKTGVIFYNNSNTYPQAGTYKLNRANWGPGLPLNVQWWTITNLTDNKFTIDFDLERFNSSVNKLDGKGVANYIIQVDIFGYDK